MCVYVHGGNRGWLKGVSVLHFLFFFCPKSHVRWRAQPTVLSRRPTGRPNWFPVVVNPWIVGRLSHRFPPFESSRRAAPRLLRRDALESRNVVAKASHHRLHRFASTRIVPQVKIQARWSRWSRWWFSTDGRGRAAVSSTHPPREAQRLPGPRCYYCEHYHLLCPEKDQDIS